MGARQCLQVSLISMHIVFTLYIEGLLFDHLAHFAVSATIPWQEGKEEDFAELREGLR